MRALHVVAVGAAMLLVGAGASAEGVAERVRSLEAEAVRSYNLRQFERALGAFEDAYRLRADASYLFDVGQCHRLLGHARESAFYYRRYLAEKPDAVNRRDVERYIVEGEAAPLAPQPASSVSGTWRVPAATPSPTRLSPTTLSPASLSSTAASQTPATSTSASLTSTTTLPAPSTDRPRWWLWAAVGAAVVVVTAGGTAVALSSHDAPHSSGATMVSF